MRTLLVLLALLAGCKRDDPEIVSRVRAGLAERERKVESYRFSGVTEQAGQRAEFRFAYRAPGKMRAELDSAQKTFTFDGKTLAQWDGVAKVVTRFDLAKAGKARAAAVLFQTFTPFAPEGFRAPLLPEALKGTREAAPDGEVLVLRGRMGEGADATEAAWKFRAPGLDLFAMELPGGGMRVEEQHCEAALGLCFPKKVVAGPRGEEATTTLSDIEVNVPLAPELFELAAPAGAKVEERAL